MSEVRTLTRLAVPVAVTQLGTMSLGLVDLWMVSRLGREAFAGVALGDIWIFGTFCLGMGVLFGLDPIVAQAHGARDGERAGRAVQRGLVLSVLLGAAIGAAWLFAEGAMWLLGQEPELAAIAGQYCRAQWWSVTPLLAFTALRQFLQGRGLMRPALWTLLLANLFNAGANWVLIFGHLGFPALGVEGAAIATGLTRVVLLATLVLWIVGFGLHRGAWTPWRLAILHPRGFRELLGYGLPTAFQIGAEVWAFQAATIFAGRLGEASLAAHTITLKIASTSFMVPLGIGAAAATRVGNLIGAGRIEHARRSAWTAVALGGGVMAASGAAFIVLRHQLGRIFTEDPEVLALVAIALPVAAAFQVFDGIQVAAAGALRGAGRTLVAAIAFLLGFYLLALPAGWWLSGRIGLAGIWWGLCIGLAAVAAILCRDLLRAGSRSGGLAGGRDSDSD
jgi:MATE family multidrug resistance protein